MSAQRRNCQVTLNGNGAVTAITSATFNATLGTATLADVGQDRAGRQSELGTLGRRRLDDHCGRTNLSGQPLHYIYGAAATNLPAAGRVTYNPVGGTTPTLRSSGQTGTLVSGGTGDGRLRPSLRSADRTAGRVHNAVYSMNGVAGLLPGGAFRPISWRELPREWLLGNRWIRIRRIPGRQHRYGRRYGLQLRRRQ